MACPTCGATDARTQILPGYWRCESLAELAPLVGVPVSASGSSPLAARGRSGKRCGTVYIQTRNDNSGPEACRCGQPAVGECSECTDVVCGEHSDLWRGWRVCDRDLANARVRAWATERRAWEAAEGDRRWRRNTLLELSDADALWMLYVQEPRSEQEIRSAERTLRRLPPDAFTHVALDVLPDVTPPVKARRSGLHRPSGWPFAGVDYHDRSWFMTPKGEWFRSGGYGRSGAEQGHCGRRVRFDYTEKRAVIYEMSWQQSMNNGIAG